MNILVVKIKTILSKTEMEKVRADILGMLEKGVLIIDESYNYEVIYEIIDLKGETTNDKK